MPPLNNRTVTAERRRQYRISSGLDEALTIGLVMANGTVHAAVPIDISAGGICLQWPLEQMVVLNIGQEAERRIQPRAVDEPLRIPAVVRWMETDADGNLRSDFQFRDAGDRFGPISPALWGLFNRRQLPR